MRSFFWQYLSMTIMFCSNLAHSEIQGIKEIKVSVRADECKLAKSQAVNFIKIRCQRLGYAKGEPKFSIDTWDCTEHTGNDPAEFSVSGVGVCRPMASIKLTTDGYAYEVEGGCDLAKSRATINLQEACTEQGFSRSKTSYKPDECYIALDGNYYTEVGVKVFGFCFD